MKFWPLRIATHDDITACGTVWRHRGRLSLTIIVKATFSLVPDGAVAPASPRPIASDDETFGGLPTRSVAVACETWPYRNKCDVTFVGNAHSSLQPSTAARLAVFRQGTALIDKVIHVFGDRDATGAPKPFSKVPIMYERALGGPGHAANPVGTDKPNLVDPKNAEKPACFAPISRHWPVRKRQLPDTLRQSLGTSVLELPESTPWAFFQAAPVDQQVDFLTGDEWIVLDGLHESAPRLATHLGGVKAEARIVFRGPAQATKTAPVPLVCDTLSLDGDALQVSLVWRGVFELQGGLETLDDLSVLAALVMPGRTIEWSTLEEKNSAPVVDRSENALTNSGEETSALAGDAVKQPATPFAAQTTDPRQTASSVAATPFSGLSSQPAPAPLAEGTIAVSTRRGGAEETIAAPSTKDAPRPIAPFPIEPPKLDEKPQVSATPWSSEQLVRAPVVVSGEQTLTAAPKVEREVSAPPPLMVAPVAIIAPQNLGFEAQRIDADAKPPVMQRWVPIVEAPRSSPAPTSVPKAKRVAITSAPITKAKPEPPPRRAPVLLTPAAMAEGLSKAGIDAQDITALLDALSPPPPPPDDL